MQRKYWNGMILKVADYLRNYEVLKDLLEKGVDANVRDDVNGLPPIMLAVTEPTVDYKTIKLLVLYGDVNLSIGEGNLVTAYHLTGLYNSHRRRMRLLIQYGADMNIRLKYPGLWYNYIIRKNTIVIQDAKNKIINPDLIIQLPHLPFPSQTKQKIWNFLIDNDIPKGCANFT